MANILFLWKYLAMGFLVNHIYQAAALGPAGAQHSLNFEVLHECITVKIFSLDRITKKV